MALSLSSTELADSAERMASTEFWKQLMRILADDEANALIALERYLENEEHPDREEVMTLCLRWHARRVHRLLLLKNVQEARDYKTDNQESEVGEQVYGSE